VLLRRSCTVSRWKTATYKPSISDLERLARFFGVPITASFPSLAPKARTNTLLSATADLNDENLEEVTLYAQFRRARRRKKTRQATRTFAHRRYYAMSDYFTNCGTFFQEPVKKFH